MAIEDALEYVRRQQAWPEIQAELPEHVLAVAAELWEECPNDFCIQHYVPFDRIIFGGVNRVIWRPEIGFRIDRSYCTINFRRHFERVMARFA